jgi:hypothetical protein
MHNSQTNLEIRVFQAGLIIFVLLHVWGFVTVVETNFCKPIKM